MADGGTALDVTAQDACDLVETMRFDPVEGLALIERHIARLGAAAAARGFAFDRHGARNALQAATFRLEVASCVRLLLARSGATAIESRPLQPPPFAPVRVTLVPGMPERRGRGTTAWSAAAAEQARAESYEILFVAPDGEVTEGSFTTPFVPIGDKLRTPASGEGVLRDELIATGRVLVGVLRPEDLAGGFLIGNAVLGLLPATLDTTKNTPHAGAAPL